MTYEEATQLVAVLDGEIVNISKEWGIGFINDDGFAILTGEMIVQYESRQAALELRSEGTRHIYLY